MDSLTATKRLFHAIVVIGMAASLGCSSDNAPGDDAGNDSSTAKDSSTKDVAVADVAQPVDAGGDAFPAWLGC